MTVVQTGTQSSNINSSISACGAGEANRFSTKMLQPEPAIFFL